MSTEHPLPGEWAWYASYDGGENMQIGPCETREIALDELRQDGGGDHIDNDGVWRCRGVVMECRENNVDLARFFDTERWLEDAGERMDDNDCGGDEDGERHPLLEISDEQQADLEASVRAAIRDWQKRHGLKLRSYWFMETRNSEDISIEIEEPAA
jgi:hypothetical protein